MKKFIPYIITRPRQSIVYGLFGILGFLLILLTVNERNRRPLKGKTIYLSLTEQSLTQLKEEEEIPVHILTKLDVLKDQEYPTQGSFIHALETTIGEKETFRNQWIILSYAWKTSWKATSNYSETMARLAVDGNLKTHWSSHVPMTFGMFFQVDIGTPALLNGLVLRVGKEKQGQPVRWIVKTSQDGEHWQTAIARQHFTHSSMLAIMFAPVQARYIQIIQTSSSSSDSPWLIHELDFLQPIIPWQFERSTLIFWVLGWIFIIMSVLLGATVHGAPWKKVGVSIVIILIILLGWFLRVYDLGSYELSEKELQHLSALNIGEKKHTEWLKGYVQNPETGISWLILLSIRWAYQMCLDYSVSIRIVPAIFGVLTIFLVLWGWKTFLQKARSFFRQEQGNIWEGIIASALVSISGFSIWLSRKGDFSISLLFFILLYLIITYRFLYQQATYGWVPILSLLVCAGFLIDPAMGYVPIGIILFGGLELFLQGSHKSRFHQKNQTFRILLYIVSVLPLYACWYFLVKKGNVTSVSLSLTFFRDSFLPGLSQLFQFSGLTGIVFWMGMGIVLVGIIQIVIRKNYGEWFLYIQGILFMLLISLVPPSEHTSPFLMLTLLLSFGFAKGITTILSFFTSKLKHQQPGLSRGQGWITQIVVLVCVVLYMVLFSFNSLFLGHPEYPYASELYQEYSRKKQINTLMDSIKTDPDECKRIVVLDQRLAELYPVLYMIDSWFLEFSELKRLSELGRFWTYIFIPISSKNNEKQDIMNFLDRYYTEIGRSAGVVLYALQETIQPQRQRYIWRDLWIGTGHHIEDEDSTTGIVRMGTPDDPPGLLSFGPFCQVCTDGRHTARFVLRSNGDSAEVVATLQVVANTYNPLASLELKGTDFLGSTAYQTFDLDFDLDLAENPAFQAKRLQFFVDFTGKSEVRLDYIDLILDPEKNL
jgi:hypothetical protein